ncbi:hypothetical protein KW848_30950 [Pseudomonas sp. PDM25]|nr:hypothetical protein [Pseudomonas sp. PDM25]
MAVVASGCSMAQTESFTFQADMPENFSIGGIAYYKQTPWDMCQIPSGEEQRFRRKLSKSEQPNTAHSVEFKVPLTDTVHGCSMVLKNVVLNIEGQWGKRELDMDMATAGLSIRDEPSETVQPFSASDPIVFQGQCQWLFRTMGPYRYIVKILQCRGLDANGVVQKSLAGGALQRDQLAGKTVKLVLTMAKEEQPYFDRYWIKTSGGWKPCKGNWGRDIEELCVTPPQFKPFKMPDGRDCTVYPNCTE